MRRILTISIALTGVIAAGCYSGSSHDAPVVSSFGATPGSLPYGGGTVTFHWNVKGAKTIDIEPVVGAVTGTAAEVTLTQGGDFTLTATNANGATTAVTRIDVAATLTVEGKVTFDNAPIAQVPVVVLGQPGTQPALTDSAGRFSIEGVAPPYDLGLNLEGSGYVIVYRGLHRPDPQLETIYFAAGPEFSASLSGTVAAGAGFPEAANVKTLVSVYSPIGTVAQSSANASDGTWSRNAGWLAASSSDLHVHAVEYTAPAGNPTGPPESYNRFGSLSFPAVADGTTLSGEDIPMSATSGAVTVTGELTHADPLATIKAAPRVDFAPGSGGGPIVTAGDSILFPALDVTNGTFTLHVPQIPNTANDVVLNISGPNAGMVYQKSGVTGGAPLQIDLPPLPRLLLPPQNAIVSSDTVFSWAAAPDSVSLLYVQAPSSLGILIFQAGSSGTIPDLSALGFVLESGQSYDWGAGTYGPFSSIDEACGPGGLLGQSGDSYNSLGSGGSFTAQ